MTRVPKRITITIPHCTFEAIIKRSNEEGRSLSNLAAFILERGINE
ncbi:MAG: ribbon-helix-helix domain-containing protein [bacterium]